MMEKYNVIIKKECISIQKNNDEPVKNKIFVLYWLFAYILQKVCEELSSETNLQDDVEEFVFEITNANSYEDILVPSTIEKLFDCLKENIKENDSIDIEVDEHLIRLDQVDMKEIFYDIIDDFILKWIENIKGSEILMSVDEVFGNVFSQCVFERVQDLGLNVKIESNPSTKKYVEYQVNYKNNLIYKTYEKENSIETIEIANEIEEGILLVIKDFLNKKTDYKYMTFPFWGVGDLVELSIVSKDDRFFIKGIHKKSNVISWLEM